MPEKPSQPAPGNYADNVNPNNLLLKWVHDKEDEDITYNIYYRNEPQPPYYYFTKFEFLAGNLREKEFQTEGGFFKGNTKYDWYVTATNQSTGETVESNRWSFKTREITPTLMTKAETNAPGTEITLTFNKEMKDPENINPDIFMIRQTSSLTGYEESFNPISIKMKEGSSNTYVMRLGKQIIHGYTVKLQIISSGAIEGNDGVELSGSVPDVINNVPEPPKPVQVSAKTNPGGTEIEMTYDKAMKDPAGNRFSYTVRETGSNSSLQTTGLKMKVGSSDTFILTLKNPIAYGANIVMDYLPGTIRSTDEGILAAYTGVPVINNAIQGPIQTSAQTNNSGTQIELIYDKAMKDPAGNKDAYTVKNLTGALETTALKMKVGSANTFILTLKDPIAYGANIVMDYSPGTVEATDGGRLAKYSGTVVVNNTAEPPRQTNAQTNNTGTQIELTYDQSMKDPTGNKDAFTVRKVSGVTGTTYLETTAIAMKSGFSNTFVLTVKDSILHGDNIRINYQPGEVEATDGGRLAAYTNKPVTNTVEPPTAPTFVKAETTADGQKIKITFDKAMSNPSGKHGQFTINVTASAEGRTSRTAYYPTEAALNAADNKIIELTINTAFSYGQIITLSYAPGDVKSAQGASLEAFTAKSVTNTLEEPVYPVCTTAVLNATGTEIALTFDQEMADPTGKADQFTVRVGSTAQTLNSISLSADKKIIYLGLTYPIGKGNSVTVSYTAGDVAATEGAKLQSFSDKAVDISSVSFYWVSKGGPVDYRTIQDAIDAVSDGDIILVATGTYAENIDLNGKNITLKSTYETDENATATTIIDGGNNSGSTIMIDDGQGMMARNANTTATVAGFTIKGGGSTNTPSAGIYVDGIDALLKDNIITQNGTTTDNKYGCGIYLKDSDSVIHDNRISENHHGNNNGAGISVNGNSDAIIYGNTFENNETESYTGVSMAIAETATVKNKAGDAWKKFNVPNATISYVEHNADEADNNVYSPNATVTNGATSGSLILFEGNVRTEKGTLVVSPSATDGLANDQIDIVLTYTLACDVVNGTVTFNLPGEASITNGASITVDGNNTDVEAGDISSEGTRVNVRIAEGQSQDEILLNYSITPATDLASGDHDFSVVMDADGTDTRYTPSESATASLTVPERYASPTIAVISPKDGVEINTTTVNLTWEATEGNVLNQMMARETGGIEKYTYYLAELSGNYGSGTDTTQKQVAVSVEYEKTYKWKVMAVGNNGKSAITTPDATFMTKDILGGKTVSLEKLNGDTSYYSTIKAALNEASLTSATLTLIAAEYKEGETLTLANNSSEFIVIQATNGVTPIIDGENTYGLFELNTDVNVTFKGLVLQNGYAATGGAVKVDSVDVTLTLEDCILKNSTATADGGGIAINAGVVTFEDGTVSYNTATERGGGFYCGNEASLTLLNTKVANNSVTAADGTGGGFHVNGATVTYKSDDDKKDIYGNTTNGNGGGIYAEGNSVFEITRDGIDMNTDICNNQCGMDHTGEGGGIYWDGSSGALIQTEGIDWFAAPDPFDPFAPVSLTQTDPFTVNMSGKVEKQEFMDDTEISFGTFNEYPVRVWNNTNINGTPLQMYYKEF